MPVRADRSNAVSARQLYREDYPSQRAALDEMPKRLCSTSKRKCLTYDRFDPPRLEKLCNRRPLLLPKQTPAEENREKLWMLRSPQAFFVLVVR